MSLSGNERGSMRVRVSITSVVVAALLAVSSAGTAQAMNPADEVFQPIGEEAPAQTQDRPAAKAETPEPEPAAAPAPEDAAESASRAEREAAFARGSRMAVDLNGYMPSLYQGKWFMPGKEDVRKCIIDREANFNYRATNGVYHGAYQMSSALARGATWMMQSEVRKEMGSEGVAIVKALRKMTPNRWNRYWQDRAFWTVWRNGAGARHWHGGC